MKALLVAMAMAAIYLMAKANATEVNFKTAFAPPNKAKIGRFADVQADAISHNSFDSAINLVYNHYAPILKNQGWTLQFNRLWSDGTVNSDTYQDGNTIIINSYGGLARYPGMNTIAAYAAVACHELGHSLGGAPTYSDQTEMSVEGQADRYATKSCMKAIGFTPSQIRLASGQLSCVLAKLEGSKCPTGKEVLPNFHGVEQGHPPAACRLKEYLGAADGSARNKCWYNPKGA